MARIVSIGELLIDFIPNERGIALDKVSGFMKKPGGAPANVAVAAKRLGTESVLVTQVGDDAFGVFLKDVVSSYGVDTSLIQQTSRAHTALAFVTLDQEGNRDFIFYRDPSADQLLSPEDLRVEAFAEGDILHFCSVSLGDYPMKETHLKVISDFQAHHRFISFDPNVRLALFKDHERYQNIIGQFIGEADLVKVAEDELTFITGKTVFEEQIEALFIGRVRYVVLTKGKHGASFHTKNQTLSHPGFVVDVKDTTGAGDAFIGALLSRIAQLGHDHPFSDAEIVEMLTFANAAAAITTTRYGAMDGLPTKDDVERFIVDQNKR
jgi:fructokinase